MSDKDIKDLIKFPVEYDASIFALFDAGDKLIADFEQGSLKDFTNDELDVVGEWIAARLNESAEPSDVKVIANFEMFEADGGYYVRDKTAVGISAYGNTPGEAIREFSIAYELFLKSLEEDQLEAEKKF